MSDLKDANKAAIETGIDEVLKKLYYNASTGFSSPDKFFKTVLKHGFKFIKMSDVKRFIARQSLNQIHRPVVKHPAKPIVGLLNTYQADLTFYEQHKKSNDGYIGLLTCMEINSRKAYVEPIKSKKSEEVTEAMLKIWKRIQKEDREMFNVEVDAGGEFNSKKFVDTMNKHGVEVYFNDPLNKHAQGKIERLNSTIRRLITLYMDYKKSSRWVDVIQELVEDNYNNREHSAIKMAPNDVTIELENELIHKDLLKMRQADSKLDIAVGDRVRVKINKSLFDKQGNTYSNAIYTIVDLARTRARLMDIDGLELVRKYPLTDLLVVNEAEQKVEVNVPKKQDAKQARIRRKLAKEGFTKKEVHKAMDANAVDIGKRRRESPFRYH